MNRLLPAALCFCAAAFLSNPAWSFQGFDLFEQIQHSIECARKPGTDYLTCTNKVVPPDDTDTTPVVRACDRTHNSTRLAIPSQNMIFTIMIRQNLWD